MSQNVDESDLKEDYPSQLRDSLRCQILLKLLLQLPRLTVIPRIVFEHMPLLEVLDLSSTSIQSLPSSISCLSSLKELLLRDCSFLIELPIEIGMLTKLKLLDIEGSEIMYIPKEIAKVTHLEVLRFCLSHYAEYYIKAKNVNGGVKVPRRMISELKKLKELCISVCQEAKWWEKEIKEIQDEICHLENLEFLKWYLPTQTTLKQFLDIHINGKPAYEHLSNFTITIGQHAQLTSCLPRDLEKKFAEFEKCLKWINAEGNIYDISKIMTRAKALFLSRHWTIVNLYAFDISKLKYFVLAECNEMETLVNIDDLSEVVENNKKSGLESLEYLSIHYMEKLKSIWEGPIGKDSLSRLRILALHTCLELTTIFTPRIAQNFSCLAELTVEECPKVRSLISTPHFEHGPLFPSLERIILIDLRELDHIFGGLIVLKKLESLMIYNCPKLRHLSEIELPCIQKIKGENKWWNSMYDYAPTWENVFEPLKEKTELIKQLLEATNSLQHFHDVISEAKDKKPLHGPGLGAQEKKEKGHSKTLPAKDEKPLDGPGLGAQETKEKDLFHTLQEAKDERSLDGPGLGAQETKEKGLFHTLPVKDEKPLDGPGLGAHETQQKGLFHIELNEFKLPLDDIISATNNFSRENYIGQGGFGAVYKGQLQPSGTMVAVKRLDSKNTSGQGQNEFLMEIVRLAGYKHDNLVTLVGFADEGGEKILVYKHEDNGSLDKHLASTDLTWEKRLRICLGAARGLDYLHSGVGKGHRVIHRDIKSSNILLNANWEAKIDFGLSKGLMNEEFTFLFTADGGTLGYLDPQYLETGILTKESDVYSFGIVLFEVLCGRLATIMGYEDERRFLSRLVKRRESDNNLMQVVWPDLQKQMNERSYRKFTKIAFKCLEKHRKQRPPMGLIVRKLESALQHQLNKLSRTKLWGSKSGGSPFLFKLESNQKLRKIIIHHNRWIHSLTFTVEDSNGLLHSSKKYGTDEDPKYKSKMSQINFDADEEMIGISGTHGTHDCLDLISSLCFVTTKKKYPSFGSEAYTSFSSSWDVGHFDGFYGRCGWYIDAVGCCLKLG